MKVKDYRIKIRGGGGKLGHFIRLKHYVGQIFFYVMALEHCYNYEYLNVLILSLFLNENLSRQIFVIEYTRNETNDLAERRNSMK